MDVGDKVRVNAEEHVHHEHEGEVIELVDMRQNRPPDESGNAEYAQGAVVIFPNGDTALYHVDYLEGVDA